MSNPILEETLSISSRVANAQPGVCVLTGRSSGEDRSLTELAVDNFAARESAGSEMINSYVRATEYITGAARRRSHVSPDGVKRHLAAIR